MFKFPEIRTPPTVSLHVAELEARIGAPLLSRTRGRIRPSAIGELLIERARRLLAEMEATLDDVERQVQGLAGRVRLGASTGAFAHLLPQVLARLRELHPDIDVQIAVLTSRDTLAQLSAGSLDVGLVALPQAAVAGLAIEPWRRDPMLAFLPEHWNAPAQVSPAWLTTRPLILNDVSTRLARQTYEWFAADGHRPQPRIELNYNEAIKSLVAAGYGATVLPHEAGAPAPDPRVAMRPLRPALWRELGIAHRADSVERATRHVLDALWALRAN